MTKKLLILTFALMMVLLIFAPMVMATSTSSRPNPVWKAEYSKSTTIPKLTPSSGPCRDLRNNPRDNASGDKITSNAHSADYPGLYFYWDDKQKDEGVLLVADWVFGLFKKGEFTLTAKNSNNYWGYTINPKEGLEVATGVYAFKIPKQVQFINEKNGKKDTDDLKNINMVFIDGEYKDVYFNIWKVWQNEDGRIITRPSTIRALNEELSFTNKFELGINKVEIKTFAEATKGKKVTFKEDKTPEGYAFKQFNEITVDRTGITNIDREGVTKNDVSFTANIGEVKTFIFTNQKQKAKITIVKKWETIDNRPIDINPTFTVKQGTTVIFEDIGVGPLPELVKAGKYTITENDIPGFTAVGGNSQTIDVVAGGEYTVTFINNEDRATVTLDKVWLDEEGKPIEKEDLPEGLTVSFSNDWKDGERRTVPAGAQIEIEEALSNWKQVDRGLWTTTQAEPNSANWSEWAEESTRMEGKKLITTYVRSQTVRDTSTRSVDVTTFKLKDITINDDVVDEVDFTAVSGKYEIVFTNQKKVRTYIQTKYDDRIVYDRMEKEEPISDPVLPTKPIPSKSQQAKWYKENGIGILAYGASSGTDKWEYRIAFMPGFFDTYKSATLRFGTDGGTVKYTRYSHDYLEGDIEVWSPPFGCPEGTIFKDMLYIIIENPHESGKEQIFLVGLEWAD